MAFLNSLISIGLVGLGLRWCWGGAEPPREVRAGCIAWGRYRFVVLRGVEACLPDVAEVRSL